MNILINKKKQISERNRRKLIEGIYHYLFSNFIWIFENRKRRKSFYRLNSHSSNMCVPFWVCFTAKKFWKRNTPFHVSIKLKNILCLVQLNATLIFLSASYYFPSYHFLSIIFLCSLHWAIQGYTGIFYYHDVFPIFHEYHTSFCIESWCFSNVWCCYFAAKKPILVTYNFSISC